MAGPSSTKPVKDRYVAFETEEDPENVLAYSSGEIVQIPRIYQAEIRAAGMGSQIAMFSQHIASFVYHVGKLVILPAPERAEMTVQDPKTSIASYLRHITESNLSSPPSLPLPAPDQNLASEFHQRLVNWITDYEKALDDAHEVGVKLVSFGQSVMFRLQSIGYWNPSLMMLRGVCDDGSLVELIQHVSQISILLMTLPRQDTSKPKRPIGFGPQSEG